VSKTGRALGGAPGRPELRWGVALAGACAAAIALMPGLPAPVRAAGSALSAAALAALAVMLWRERQRGPDQWFHDLSELAPCGYHSVDETGTVIHMNQTELAWLGYSAGEMNGKRSFFDLLTPESRKLSEQHFTVLKRDGMVRDLELEMLRRDGSILPVMINATAVNDAQGRFLYSRSTAVDITALYRARQQERAAAEDLERRVKARTAELMASENRFRMLAETVPQMIWCCLPDGSCDYLNRRWLEYTGLPEETQLGQEWWKQVHPDDRDWAVSAWQAATAGGEIFDAEVRIQRHDGVYRWFKTRAIAWRDEHGAVLRWFGTNTDIDVLRRAQDATRLWRLAFEHAEIAISITNSTSGNVNIANSAYARLLGYEPSELSRLTIERRYPPEEWQHIAEVLRQADEQNHISFESMMVRKDGARVPVRIDLTSVHGSSGELLSRVAFITDLTASRTAEAAINAQATRLALAQEATRFGVFEWDMYSGRQFWSESQERLYGIQPGTFGNSLEAWLEFLVPEDCKKVRESQRANSVTGTAWNEFRIRRQDTGEVRWIEARSKVYNDENGRPARTIGINVDITERKKAEQEILRLNSELEERVRSRTRQLEELNRELEAFAYSVSHDLRTPLRGIDGWSLALEEDCSPQLDDRGRQYIQRVRTEAQRMGQLIDDLLGLSRLNRATLARAGVDLSALAHSVAARLEEQASGRHLVFEIEPDVKASGDEHLLEIALTNLLANAVKFSSRRETARIEFGTCLQDGERVYFVRDNGVGFDMTYARNLFGAFQRLHRASDFPGTGIGLATVRRIVQRHGGRVWADAAVDRGATFYFTLPAA